MKPLYQALAAGMTIGLFHALILLKGWTLWDISIISVSSLSAGIFFILGMIFRSTVQDYKQADIAIAQLRGKLLSMNDINEIAADAEASYDPSHFRRTLLDAVRTLRGYIENGTTHEEANAALSGILRGSKLLRSVLPPTQTNLLLKQHEDIRQHVSYLAYLKHHNFPIVGYVFLWFFVAFVIGLQLFSVSEYIVLDILFIFSLSSILVFFIAFIHDLDHPFRCHLACFSLDTRPLLYTESVLDTTEKSLPCSQLLDESPISAASIPLYQV